MWFEGRDRKEEMVEAHLQLLAKPASIFTVTLTGVPASPNQKDFPLSLQSGPVFMKCPRVQVLI